ncbi:MAG: calcium-binding protein [Paracoccaceae bacterium]|nr:calcium-binding protein [Paracoccaceae bacterium]
MTSSRAVSETTYFLGGEGDDILSGETGIDTIEGGDGDDVARGGDDDDFLSGGSGNDTLDGNLGDDMIDGGLGNDALIGASGDNLIFGREGDDAIRSGGGDDVLYGGEGNDRMLGSANNDTLYGGIGNDILDGNTQADELFGNQGNDILRGGDGFDVLWGDNDDDILVGGNGNDILEGGKGIDILRGNTQNDTFRFQFASHSKFDGSDLIDGIEGVGVAGGDIIDVSGINADLTSAENSEFTFPGLQTRAAEPCFGAGALWLENDGAQTRVYGNIDNDNLIELAIRIKDGVTIAASDYLASDFILQIGFWWLFCIACENQRNCR